MNLFNANCDSARPRTKRELLRDLDIWERSQGGHAPNVNGPSNGQNDVMRKDFDGHGWAESNKDQFAELIANAKRKRASQTSKEQQDPQPNGSSASTEADRTTTPPTSSTETSRSPSTTRPYEGNESALSIIRAKVEAANQEDPSLPPHKPPISPNSEERPIPSILSSGSHRPPGATAAAAARRKSSPRGSSAGRTPSSRDALIHEGNGQGVQESPCTLPEHVSMHMGSPTVKKMPMFEVPQAPVSDVENGNAVGG